jgi:hypothetical protein
MRDEILKLEWFTQKYHSNISKQNVKHEGCNNSAGISKTGWLVIMIILQPAGS